MRRLMVVAAVLTAFSQSSTVAFGDSPPPRPRGSNVIMPRPEPTPPRPYPQTDSYSLCRRAPALPQIGTENQNNQNQQPSRWSPRDREVPMPMVVPAPASGSDGVTSPPPPPPPPPPMEGMARAEVAPAIVAAAPTSAPSRSARATSKVAPSSAADHMPPPRRGYGNQQVQSGQLTAGEHDDLLNPALYARYVTQFLAGETLHGVPRVDTGKALYVTVTDTTGAPMPFATVTLRCSDNNTLSLTTMADGRAVFFPDLDRLGQTVFLNTSMPRLVPVGYRR